MLKFSRNSHMESQDNLDATHHASNCANCFEVPPDPMRPSCNSKNPTLFFNDGRRSIDFVLVWKIKLDEDPAQAMKRNVFQDNLLNEGLEIEREVFDDLHFVKVSFNSICLFRSVGFFSHISHKILQIHAPGEVLRRYSEILKLRLPMKEVSLVIITDILSTLSTSHNDTSLRLNILEGCKLR